MSSGETIKPNPRSRSMKQPSDNVVMPQPTASVGSDVFRIVSDLVLFFCRRVIFAPVPFKLILYFLLVLIGSSLKSFELAPTSYFSLKTNIFNVYFAKLGWGWTVGLLIPFIYLNLQSTHTPRQIVVYHLSRLVVATVIWYIATNFFVALEAYTGTCLHDEFRGVSRRVCTTSGHKWQDGHDISGHTFLFIYTLLIINEEVKSYDKAWRNTKKSVDSGDSTATAKSSIVALVIFVLYVSLAVLTVIWEIMLLSTALYFHHTLHKLEAVAIATGLWVFTYQLWYSPEMSSMFRPASPKDYLIS